ncbi:hypothetical protein FPQ18DRAFT_396125 [Pyronema domesticum]|nr:hypothetical protein FPQ18DRAFT_396125 [Pyronema domesticum]
MSTTIISDEVDRCIELSARTVISVMNDTGLHPLEERVEELEDLCEKLIEKNSKLEDFLIM